MGVHAKTRDWHHVIVYEEDNGNFKPILFSDTTIRNGSLFIPPEEVEKEISLNREFLTEFHLYHEFQADGDNFSFETKFTNNYRIKGKRCYSFKTSITGKNSASKIEFSNPGCIGNLFLQFGDVHLNGNYKNLAEFGINLKKWNVLKGKFQDKSVQVFLNEEKIYDTTYNKKIGDIKGISFNFKGIGKVDYLKVYNDKKKLVFRDDFDKPNTETPTQ